MSKPTSTVLKRRRSQTGPRDDHKRQKVETASPCPGECSKELQRDQPEAASGDLSVTDLISKVSSSDTKKSHQALVEVRTRIMKYKDAASRLRQRGAPQALLDKLLKGDDKAKDVCLSILGNCCMDTAFRKEIIQRDGVSVIGTVLMESKSSSIQNRSCRTLANIAIDSEGCKKCHEEELLLEAIIKILSETKDLGSQQSFLRFIRLLSDTKPHRIAILHERGLKVVADLLTSKDENIQKTALKTVAHFINSHPTEQCALQLDLAETPKCFLSSVIGQKTSSSEIQDLILTMVKHECFRPGLGNAGGISYFLDQLKDDSLHMHKKYAFVNALCLFCKESLNRVRLREHGALEVLVDFLKQEKFRQIHNRIISAFLCFLYDDQSFQVLLDNNVIELMMINLAKCTRVAGDRKGCLNLGAMLDAGLTKLLKNVLVGEDVPECEDTEDDTLSKADVSAESCLLGVRNDVNLESAKGDFTETVDADANDLAIESTGAPDQDRTPPVISIDVEVPDAPTLNDTCAKATIKYSMDSPTYKEITESRGDSIYDPDGPTNILDCQDVGGLSPGYRSPSWPPASPMSSSSSYETFSPMSNSVSYASPDWSPCSSTSIKDDLFESPQRSPSVDYPSRTRQSLPSQFSPLHTSTYTSPTKSPQYSPFLNWDVPSPDPAKDSTVVPEYSSSEDDCDETYMTAKEVPNEPEIQVHDSQSDQDAVCEERGVVKSGNHKHLLDSAPSENLKKELNKLSHEKHDIDSVVMPLYGNQPSSNPESSKGQDARSVRKPSKPDGRESTEGNILVFLSRVSFMENADKYLVTNSVIEGILNYLAFSEFALKANWQRAHRIFLRILKGHTSLDMMLAIGVPIILNIKCDKYINREDICRSKEEEGICDTPEVDNPLKYALGKDGTATLSLVAQYKYGLGISKHALMTGTMERRVKTYLSIPLLYSNRKDLKSMLCRFPHGIQIVVHCLASDNDVLFAAAVTFISHFTNTIMGQSKLKDLDKKLSKFQVDNQQAPSTPQGSTSLCVTHKPPMDNSERNVTLVLSDKSEICASKEVLCEVSSVFSAMLKGTFMESGQSRIHIPDAGHAPLRTMIDFLHVYPNTTGQLTDIPLDHLLDVLVLSERFLLRTLQLQVSYEIGKHLTRPLDCDIDSDHVNTVISVLRVSLMQDNIYITERCFALLFDCDYSLSFRESVMRKCIGLESTSANSPILTYLFNALHGSLFESVDK